MNICILGGAGFIGSHLAKRLKGEGNYVRVVDIKENEYMEPVDYCNEFHLLDLRNPSHVEIALTISEGFDEVYQFAADMGGSGYIFTGENDANVMHNSALINLNVAYRAVKSGVKRLFYSSSACTYPSYNQTDPDNPNCEESSAIPAAPDSCYGWEKLFSEFLYDAFHRNYGLKVRMCRFHNIFGPLGTWRGGKEKAPAAICCKVAITDFYSNERKNFIEIWGDGLQTRSFLYIDEAIEGVIRLMRSDCRKILNIGSEEMISINDLAKMIIRISGKGLVINNIPGPEGVRGRNSDNKLIQKELGWSPSTKLEDGITILYNWINQMVNGTK